MNMSGHYTGQYYQPFGPPTQPNQPYRQPSYPPYGEYNPFCPPNYPSPPQYFAEYNLWGSSSYNRLEPAELIHPTISPRMMHPLPPFSPRVEFQQESRPPILPLSQMHSRPQIPPIPQRPQTPPRPQMPPDEVAQTEDEAVGGSEEVEMTGFEEMEKKTIEKALLYKLPDKLENSDVDDSSQDSVGKISNSSGSTDGNWTQTVVQRAGAYPPSYPWASRPARVVNNRGRKANVMQRRLVRALSQPVKLDKGASMMQRMGWMGGGLGREENGIVDPVQPDATYATSTIGFGQEVETISKRAMRRNNRPSALKKKGNKQNTRGIFKNNLFVCLLDFVKNDLLLELYFDTKLVNYERKRIHRLVSCLDGREKNGELNGYDEIADDIRSRNHYLLNTQSAGEGAERQICVFKSAPNYMFLVTPDDCRPCITDINEVEEEPNPFLKSITKHIKKDEGTILKPKPPHLFDKLIEFFIDFSADEVFTEFRFLGPFTAKEINVINNFFSLISELAARRKPHYKVPVELLDVFVSDIYCYCTELDLNGFTSVQKIHFDLREEYEKHLQEMEKKRRDLQHPLNHYPLKFHIRKPI